MTTISSTGLGSGLDVNSIVTSLMSVEKQPLALMKKEETSISAKISSLGKLQANLATLRDKASALTSASLWSGTVPTVSDSSVATVSTLAGQTATAGSHSLQVVSLAAAQTLGSATLPSAASTLSEGSLTIELGTWGSGTPAAGFTAKAGATPVTVSIAAGKTSLSDIRDQINSAGAGVVASIVTDASGARLSLRSASTGAENGFRITATETADDGVAATGLSALSFDAAAVSSPMTRVQSAANAQAVVDGMSVSSASNTLDGVLDGLSIKLLKPGSGSATDLTVAPDTASVRTALNDFVSAFNAVASQIQTDTGYNATTKTGATLQGDHATVTLQSRLRGVLNTAFGGTGSGGMTRLSDLGITMSKDGTLATSTTRQDKALGDPAAVRALLGGGDGSSTALTGFMTRFKKLADSALGQDGLLDGHTAGLKSRLKQLTDGEARMQQRLDATEKRLRAQYQSLDQSMSRLNALSGSVTQMVNNLSSGS